MNRDDKQTHYSKVVDVLIRRRKAMSKTIKKSLSVFLAVIMILTLTPLTVFGSEESAGVIATGENAEQDEIVSSEYIELSEDGSAVVKTPEMPESGSFTYVNPLYEDLKLPEQSETKAKFYAAANPYYDNTEDAAAYVRTCMVNRKAAITFDMFTTVFDNWQETLIDQVFKHTGNSVEGDYLTHTFYSYDVDFSSEPLNSDGVDFVVHVTIDAKYLTTKAQEDELSNRLKSVVESLNLKGLTDYQKAKAIYKYITENVKYDHEGLNDDSDYLKYTAYGALVEKSAVCQGYANLLYRMLLEQNMDSRIITSTELNHAWNVVELSGMYYYLDSTWDSASDGKDAGEKYFLKGKTDFSGHDADDTQYSTELFEILFPLAAQSYNVSNPETNTKYVGVIAKDQCGDNTAWFLKNDGTFIVSGKGAMWDVSSKGVTPIKDYLASIKKIQFEEGVTSVGDSFFREAPNLKTIVFSDSIESIGIFAFLRCNLLESVHLPNGLKRLKQECFNHCDSLEEFVIPGSVTFFDHPCGGKKLKKVVIEWDDSNSGSLTYASGSFAQIEGLEEIVVDENHHYLKAVDGVLYGKGTFTESGLEYDEPLLAYPYKKSGAHFQVPEWCTGIGYWAFYNIRNLESVSLHDGVKYIDTMAFWGPEKLALINLNCKTPTVASNALANYSGTIYYAGCSETEWNKSAVRKKWAPNATWIKGHNVSQWTLSKPATFTSNAVESGHCLSCNTDVQRELIPKIGTVSLNKEKLTYTGSGQAPALTVKDAKGNKLVKGTDYTVSGLDKKTNVGRYKVTVTFKGNYSGKKELYFTIVPKTPASAKATLTAKYGATAGYDDVKFSWAKSTGASGYEVYYKKSSASSYTKLGDTKNTYYYKKNLADGVKYSFKVMPYYKDSNGNKHYSPAPKTATIYTLKKLSVPTISRSGSKVKVKWTNISGETGYQISKSTSKTGTNIVSTYTTTSGTYKLISATKGKTYYYKVRAYKKVDGKNIYGPWSSVNAFKR